MSFASVLSQQLGRGYPDLASPTSALGRGLVGVLSLIRQRDGEEHVRCSQIRFSRLFTWPADQPRHAARDFHRHVETGSPPFGKNNLSIRTAFRQINGHSRLNRIMPPKFLTVRNSSF